MTMRVVSIILVLLIAANVVRLSANSLKSISGSGSGKSHGHKAEYETAIVKRDDEQQEAIIQQEQETSDTEQPSLSSFLGGLQCNGCGRHCSLLSPSCGKGERQAESAKEEYYETYSSDSNY